MEHQNNNQKIDLKDLNIKKVKETRYKILIFVILLISYLAYPYLAGIYSEVQSLKESIVEKQKILKQKDRQIVDLKNVESKIKFFEKNK
jgi:Tfp pilus assembly protein PilO